MPPDFDAIITGFREGKLPATEAEFDCLQRLTCLTVEVAMRRHAGRIEVVYGPNGETLVQHGKDLTRIATIIGTGGPVIYSPNPQKLLECAIDRSIDAASLKPRSPRFYVDESYILYAVGLLSQVAPEQACRLARKYIKQV